MLRFISAMLSLLPPLLPLCASAPVSSLLCMHCFLHAFQHHQPHSVPRRLVSHGSMRALSGRSASVSRIDLSRTAQRCTHPDPQSLHYSVRVIHKAKL